MPVVVTCALIFSSQNGAASCRSRPAGGDIDPKIKLQRNFAAPEVGATTVRVDRIQIPARHMY